MSSPTSRTLQRLIKDGWTAQVVEKWIPQARRRIDLWGIGDVIAMKVGEPILLIQATTTPNVNARRAKIALEPRLKTWLAVGGSFEVWGWSKTGPRGGRKTWALFRVPVRR